MNNSAQNGSFRNVTDNQILLTNPGQDAFYHASNQLLKFLCKQTTRMGDLILSRAHDVSVMS